MKINLKHCFAFCTLLFLGTALHAQYGYGSGYGYGYGRHSAIPRAQEPVKEPEPLTAEQIVDNEMPMIAEALDLNDFEVAVLSSTLKKYVQQRIEMQILKLNNEQIIAGMERITAEQDKELKAGLPPEKYEAFVAMQKDGLHKTQKKLKKEKKKKSKN